MTDTLTLDALAAVKEKQQATWASGDYAVIGTSLQIIGEQLCESVDVSAGQRVLDVAAGNGNAALAAARRGCDVTATDYVESLLERARRRADADGLPLTTQVADAEDLPFDDEGKQSIHDQLVALANGANRNTDGALTIDSEYLDVIATRR